MSFRKEDFAVDWTEGECSDENENATILGKLFSFLLLILNGQILSGQTFYEYVCIIQKKVSYLPLKTKTYVTSFA